MKLRVLLLASLLPAQDIRIPRMQADLDNLTTPIMNGRVALEPGARLAADFIATQFRQAGLQPCCDGSYLQEFTLIAPLADSAASRLFFNGATLAHTGTFKEPVDLKAPLVFAGYGITAPEYRYDDYRGIDAQGKIVVILDREPGEADAHSIFLGTGSTKHIASRVKRLNAQRHGAVAVLMIPSPKSTTAPSANERTPLRGAAPLMLDDALRIPLLTLTAESAARLLPDYAQLQNTIDRSTQPSSRPITGEAELHVRNRSVRTGATWNVIGILPGTSKESVLLTSHYDHLPARGTNYYPGANDNGSGTVGVIELARAFAARHQRPRRTLVFISFGAEEEGLLGANHYVDHPLFPLQSIKAVINLDMIGRDEQHTPQTEGRIQVPAETRNHLNVLGGVYFPALLRQARKANARVGLELDEKFDHDSTQNALYRCDHFPFLVAGVPDLWFFAGWHPGYHEPSDTPEKINWDKMQKVVRLAYLTADRLAR